MTRRKPTRTFLAACSAVALSAVVYGCGGGGGGDASVLPAPVDFSGVATGYALAAGNYEIAAGETLTVGDVTFSCAAGGADCTVTVADDGMAIAAAGSGEVSAANSVRYQARLTQRTAAGNALAAAQAAVAALTVASPDGAVAAAEAAVAAAKAAVAAGTLLTAADMAALNGAIADAEASLGTVKTAIADRNTHDSQLGAATAAVAAAKSAVDALDRMSADAAIAAAQAAIGDAVAAVAAGTKLTAGERSAAEAQIAAFRLGLEKVSVEARVYAAESAVNGLTAASTDAEVDAAQAAISAAAAALRKVQLLTGPEVIAFQGKIETARANLANKRTQIADSKDHRQQLAALESAVAAAKTAVDGLSKLSTDAALDAAQAAIAAAEAAVAAGTKLTTGEKSAASTKLAASRVVLEKVTVEAGIYTAETLVAGLSVTSTDAELAAAQAALAAASAALRKVTMLTPSEVLAFRDSIDAVGDALEEVRAGIAGNRTHETQLAAVNGAVSAAQAAVAALSAGSTDAEANGAAGKIQAAKDAVSAGTALTDAEKAAALETIAAAETTLVTRRAAITARRSDARAMSAALKAAPGTTFDANLTDIDGGKVSIAGYGKSATDTAPAMAGWAGSVYEDVTMGADGTTVIETDTVVVYTDKAPSKSARYTTYYARSATAAPDSGTSAGFSWQPWVGVEGVSDDTNGILNLTGGIAIEAPDVDRLFDTGNFGAGQEKLPQKGDNRTYADEDDAVAGTQVALTGSFHGVAGTFKCAGTTCTAERTNAGALTLAGSAAAWTFAPAATNVGVAGAQEDADYLDFGYWIEWDADGGSGNTPAYRVEAFFRGEDPHGAVDAVEGTASYSGKAAGVYTNQVYEGNTLLDERLGRFTADVALEAYFGGDDVAVSNQNSIGGTISNFMDGGQPIDSGWSVTLNRIGGAGGSGSFSGGEFTGGTTAGGSAAGTWSGAFYGDHAEVGGATPQPSGVAGEFTAGFYNGDVVGAFGASKQ